MLCTIFWYTLGSTFLFDLTGLLAGGDFRGVDNFYGCFLATTGFVRGDASCFLTSRGDETLLVLFSPFLMKRGDAKFCLGLP